MNEDDFGCLRFERHAPADDGVGEVLEVVPPERLVLTMTDEPASEARARLVVELAPVGGGTRMVFRQQTPGFTAEQRAATAAGWGTFFDELEAGLPPASR